MRPDYSAETDKIGPRQQLGCHPWFEISVFKTIFLCDTQGPIPSEHGSSLLLSKFEAAS